MSLSQLGGGIGRFLIVDGVTQDSWVGMPQYGSRVERLVWRELFSQLKAGEAILPSVRLTDPRHGDVEADILIFVPDLGVAVLEVKGGKVVYEDGEWTTRRRRRQRKVQPVQQARRAKHALRRYLDRQPEWQRGLIRSTWFVVFPNTVVTGDLGPEGRRAQILDQLDLPRAMTQIRLELANSLNTDPFPDSDDLDTAISLVLRNNPGVTPKRRFRIPTFVKNALMILGAMAVAGVITHVVARTWGWPWGIAVLAVAVPLVSVGMWLNVRHGRAPRLLTAAAAFGTGLAVAVGAGTVVRAQEPWLLQSTCAVGYAPCLPVVDDLDCSEIRELVTVRGDDPYRLDRNGDGIGCESFIEQP